MGGVYFPYGLENFIPSLIVWFTFILHANALFFHDFIDNKFNYYISIISPYFLCSKPYNPQP